jgi:hypothetical protein
LNISDTIEVTAIVTQIDAAKRTLTLKTDAGDEYAVDVDESVRNLPQVKVGDRVVAHYHAAIGATMRKAGDPAAAAMDLEARQAAPGQRPGVTARRTTTVLVTINSVDTKSNVVKFHGEDKLVRELAVHRPEARAFIKQLKPGDQVVVTYAESVAISVEPAKPAK